MDWTMFRDSIPVYVVKPWLIAVFFAIVGLAFIPGGDRAIAFVRSTLNRIAEKSWRSIACVGVTAVLLVGTLCAIGKVRPPEVHDEISYLLAADTFLHGRLTNPTPPFWENFQTFHELMVPTYQSKFPVGQGIALAAGRLLGSFRVGAFGTVALACAAVCWMFLPVMPRRWAIVGGLLAAAHPLVFGWGQTFWGGGVAMLGGALLGGSALRIARLMKMQRLGDRKLAAPVSARSESAVLEYSSGQISDRDEELLPPSARGDSIFIASIIGAVGYGILMNSRPLEGTILGAILLGMLIAAARSNRTAVRSLWLLAVPVGLLTLVPFFAFMGLYNYRVTGSATTLPYALHSSQYMHSPLFWWQSPHEPKFVRMPNHMAAFYSTFETGEWQDQQSLSGFLNGVERKVLFVARDAFVPIAILIVVLVGAPFALRQWPVARLAVVVCGGLLIIHMSITPWLRSQYLALIVPMYMLLLTLSLRAMNRWQPMKRPIGSAATLALFVVMALASFHTALAIANAPETEGAERLRVIDSVDELPGKHLVFVVYEPVNQNLYEWVNNSADIEGQRVIFIHPLDMDSAELIRKYFADRSLWELKIAGSNAQLRPLHFTPEAANALAMKAAAAQKK